MTITEHTGPLSNVTSPPGIVALAADYTSAAVQCSVCHRVNHRTGPHALVRAVSYDGWHFGADPGQRGHLPYRRCPDCRGAGLHPEEN